MRSKKHDKIDVTFLLPTRKYAWSKSRRVYAIVLFRIMRLVKSDASLVSAHLDGDTHAFEELYSRYFKQVYGAVYLRTFHRETAEDIVSQTFLQALERLDSYRSDKGAFGAWLHRIARNLVFDHFRSSRPHQDIEDFWDLPSDDDVAANADAGVRLDAVRSHMHRLSPSQREVLMLRIWQGLPFAEIAEITGSTEAACKMQCKRALETLRTTLLVLLFLLTVSVHGLFS